MYKRLMVKLYWAEMKNDVKKYVEECHVCQRNKALAVSLEGLLLPLAVPDAIWEDMSMDFIEGLPKSQGFDVIFLVVDHPWKYSHFIGLRHLYSVKVVAKVFIKEVVRLHGYLKSIVSNRHKVFLSNF